VIDVREIRHFHLFGAIGGGGKGFNRAKPRVGNMHGRFRCIGSVDVDAAANRDFARLVGVAATTLDLFDREQYVAFHGRQPPADWREATPQDIQRAAGGERPHIVFLSAPCKGFSGLLSEGKSKTEKYQALNRLTLRGVWLMLEAWRDDLPELVVFENVPRIATRGRHLLDQIAGLLRAYGYAVAETTHDCGEIGGLGQSRKRFLMVARHIEKVPPFLYEPDKKRLRGVGEILGRMPLPGDPCAGTMHRIPSLQWKTWVRLAFVEAGSDWRSLNKLAVQDGVLRDYLIVPCGQEGAGVLGVNRWSESIGAVAGRSGPTNGAFSVADPRAPVGALQYGQYGVNRWGDNTGAVIGVKSPGQGTFSVADPRPPGVFQKWRITRWNEPSITVISGSTTGQGAVAVADPRAIGRGKGDHYLTGGHYGVVPWDSATGAVSSSACHDNGNWSVADPRPMPAPADKLVAIIRALDGTWHRPFTTLELAALQSLLDPEESWVPWRLDGESDQAWRERIGNAVPSAAAEAIAEVMGETLLLAWSGETFLLSSRPVWVRPLQIALSVQGA
jgi:site-specific DNA-cytosine methylase